jgi:hypothetical protein
LGFGWAVRGLRLRNDATVFGSEVTLIEDPTPAQNKSAFIWSVFQSQRAMEEFIVVGFKGHPSIVKEMSLFMVTERVDHRKLWG